MIRKFLHWYHQYQLRLVETRIENLREEIEILNLEVNRLIREKSVREIMRSRLEAGHES
jgi:hypothetical protein